ncbi:ABC transporter ATP-binding protein [Gudongella sp. DL1XJH-153]|uniref:ABC transporter ATP-binding protein n=1 Tax=Gudongella sp. DL1XJH-153 TaxID=3409804 RepID=UPI003BB6A19C
MLEVRNLSKKFKEGFQLEDVSFTLEPGYIMGFIGPNGAGKTTTINLIMNLMKRDDGSVKIFGKDNIQHEKEIKDRIGFVYDEAHFYDDLTLEQMKRIIAPFYTRWDEKLYRSYIRNFELDEKMRIKKLSKGMKMKYSLALALSHDADLIIMDEPTSGLDPIFRKEILDILYDIIQDENKSIFFSTHITTDLEQIADYITFINKGKLVFSKAKDEIMDEFKIVKGDTRILTPEIRSDFIEIRETGYGFEGLTRKATGVKGMLGENSLVENASLQDIMYYMRMEG